MTIFKPIVKSAKPRYRSCQLAEIPGLRGATPVCRLAFCLGCMFEMRPVILWIAQSDGVACRARTLVVVTATNALDDVNLSGPVIQQVRCCHYSSVLRRTAQNTGCSLPHDAIDVCGHGLIVEIHRNHIKTNK
jgi:hypothetical protein